MRIAIGGVSLKDKRGFFNMLKISKRTGFASVLEVIITAVIFSLAAFGVLSTVSMLRPHSREAYREVEAAYYAKNMMDYLRTQVEAEAWQANTGPLATGVTHSTVVGDYTIDWTLTDVNPAEYPAGFAPRKLSMNVSFPD